eukprot:2652807-Amphidinium_carterae.1
MAIYTGRTHTIKVVLYSLCTSTSVMRTIVLLVLVVKDPGITCFSHQAATESFIGAPSKHKFSLKNANTVASWQQVTLK